jgi:hypothetical protein
MRELEEGIEWMGLVGMGILHSFAQGDQLETPKMWLTAPEMWQNVAFEAKNMAKNVARLKICSNN